jgi:hypothetical protein
MKCGAVESKSFPRCEEKMFACISLSFSFFIAISRSSSFFFRRLFKLYTHSLFCLMQKQACKKVKSETRERAKEKKGEN